MHIENAFLENLFYLYREYRRVKKTTAGTKMKQHLFLKEIRRLKFKTNTLHLVPLSNKNNNKLVLKNYSSTLHSGVLRHIQNKFRKRGHYMRSSKKRGWFYLQLFDCFIHHNCMEQQYKQFLDERGIQRVRGRKNQRCLFLTHITGLNIRPV